MTEGGMTAIAPGVVAANVEGLRRSVAEVIAAAEAECRRATDRLNAIKGQHAEAEAAHEKRLAEMTARMEAEHAKRIKEIAKRELNLANGQRELQADRERVAARELAAEQRAAYLTARLQGTAA